MLLIAVVACSKAPDVSVEKIWDNDYSSFPSIAAFNGMYYVSFREAGSHVDKDGIDIGKTRILRSADGTEWESVALLEKEGYDLRDPKLSVTPDGRLMIIMGGSVYEDRTLVRMDPHVSFSTDGVNFSEPRTVCFEGLEGPLDKEWIWRITWHDGVGYGVTYGGPQFALLKTEDGITYRKVCDLGLSKGNFPGESTIRFAEDGRMYMMVRCDRGDKLGRWGWSDYPYADWTWTDMDFHLGGPDFIFLGDGSLYAGSRYFLKGEEKTMLLRGTKEGKFEELYLLPSGGDTSYPGFLETKDELWMVYYSCHETMEPQPRACIFLAKFSKDHLPDLEETGCLALE